MTDTTFPRFQPVADHAVLVEFGESIDKAIHDRVRRLDAALDANPFAGYTEAVPAFASVLVGFDPLVTDHARVEAEVRRRTGADSDPLPAGDTHEVLVCYDADFGPDLAGVAAATGLSEEAVIAAHLAGDYSVFMFGFAPGYAYLGGTPAAIQVPRKPGAVRDIAAGSVLIAGAMCLVTTLVMPTGWWIIGRSPTRILRDDETRPVLFGVGDRIAFRRIDRAAYEAETARSRP